MAEARPETRRLQDAARRPVRNETIGRLVRVIDRGLTDPPEPFRRCRECAIKKFRHLVPKPQVGVADDPRADAAIAVDPAGADRPNSVGEFDLAQGPQHLGAIDARKGSRLDIDRSHDPMTGLHIGKVFVEHVPQWRPMEQMVMGIDDPDLRLKDRLVAPDQKLPVRGRSTGGKRHDQRYSSARATSRISSTVPLRRTWPPRMT